MYSTISMNMTLLLKALSNLSNQAINRSIDLFRFYKHLWMMMVALKSSPTNLRSIYTQVQCRIKSAGLQNKQ